MLKCRVSVRGLEGVKKLNIDKMVLSVYISMNLKAHERHHLLEVPISLSSAFYWLFAIHCSLFAVRCSLFAVRCSLFQHMVRLGCPSSEPRVLHTSECLFLYKFGSSAIVISYSTE